MTNPTDSEAAELLHAIDATIEAARRLTTLTERLPTRATSAERLND